MSAPARPYEPKDDDELDDVLGPGDSHRRTNGRRFSVEHSDEGAAGDVLPTTSAAELCAGELEPIEYVVPPIFVRGGKTIVYGQAKVGKTTFVAHAIHGVLDPMRYPFLPGTQRIVGPALWLDLDQPRRVSRRRFAEAGADIGLQVYRGLPPTLKQLADTIDALRADALVVDNVTKWLQLENENDSSEFERKFGPIQHVLDARDVMLVAIDHATKSEGSSGKTLRGTGHKLASFDIIVEMRAEGPLIDGRRRLSFTSREEIVPDMIVRLDRSIGQYGRYVLEGSPASAAATENEQRIFAALRAGHQRKDELARALTISTKTLESWIKPLIDRGDVKPIQSTGAGRPIVYHIVSQRTSGKSLGSSQLEADV